MTKREVSWDTETHLIKPGMAAPRLVCATFDEGDHEGDISLRDQGLDRIETHLREDYNITQHGFFDLGVTAAEKPKLLPLIFDAVHRGDFTCTKIRQMLIDNASGSLKFIWDEDKNEFKRQNYSLAAMVKRHFQVDMSADKEGPDIWRLRYNELDGAPLDQWPEGARQYAMNDAIWTRKIWRRQEREMEPLQGEKETIQAAWALYLTQLWGVRTNGDAVAALREEVEHDYNEQEEIAVEYGFIRGKGAKAGSKDMKKIQAAIEKWYKENDLPMKITPSGAIATDREQLTTTDHPGLHAVAEHGKWGKLLKTYVPALERGVEVPLNPNYNSMVESFRTSCSGGMKIDGIPLGFNIQNPPRKGGVRECIQARPGYVFAFCDYDTLEMLTLAQNCIDLFGFSRIAEAAEAGQDFHLALAADMIGMPYRDAEEKLKAGDAQIANARQFAKIGNYGFAGGMSPKTFIDYAKGYGEIVSMNDAKALWGGFRRKWGEMEQYFQFVSQLCDGGKAPEIIHPRTGMQRGRVRYTAACNHFFQHLAAIGAKEALYQTVRECYIDSGSPLYGSRPWLFAHDEIGLEIPIGHLGPQKTHEAAQRLEQVMVSAMKRWCPDVPIAATVAMSYQWFKGAKPVHEKGILLPCRPEGKLWVADKRAVHAG